MRRCVLTLGVCLAAATAMPAAGGDDARMGRTGGGYEVTITNITKDQTFTPAFVASHQAGVSFFELGSSASAELESLAETGDIGPLVDRLSADPRVKQVVTTGGLLAAGESVTVEVEASGLFRRVSLGAMLIPTNDGFFALSDVAGPWHGEESHFSPAYDAGTEENDEDCSNIPGPQCMGSGAIDAGADEDFVVHVHSGIHGAASLSPASYDWRNPVARIVIRRVR